MTAARFNFLKQNPEQVLESEKAELASTLAWEQRHEAALRAVATKRTKYKTWPTRRNDHK